MSTSTLAAIILVWVMTLIGCFFSIRKMLRLRREKREKPGKGE
jgi:hypothetical protein